MPDPLPLLRPSASVAVETDMREFERLADVIVHLYPRHVPQPGDIALCGWVKRDPNPHPSELGPPTCGACIRTDRSRRA